MKGGKRHYYRLKIEECSNDQKKVFNIANELMNNTKDSTLPTSGNPQELSEKFADFFTDKIAKIKESFDNKSVSFGPSEADESPTIQYNYQFIAFIHS